jgi:hypothetical protein
MVPMVSGAAEAEHNAESRKKIEGHRADDHPGNAKGGPSDGVYIGVKGNLVQPAIRSLHDLQRCDPTSGCQSC